MVVGKEIDSFLRGHDEYNHDDTNLGDMKFLHQLCAALISGFKITKIRELH